MTSAFIAHLQSEIDGLKSAGLYKSERVITSKQAGEIAVASGERVLNFCANNYLGLAENAELAEAGKRALDRYGYGMASVRFICGTQEEHRSSRRASPPSSGLRTPSSIPHASMPMAASSRRCSPKRTPSSPTR